MPKFIFDRGSPAAEERFAALDPFTQGYIEAAFFTETGYPEDEELENASFADLAPEAITQAETDCARFIKRLPRDGMGRSPLDLANDCAPEGYSDEQAGRDFWFTRNGHGVGFWDRGLGPVGDTLSEVARAAGCRDMYRGDDGLIYFAWPATSSIKRAAGTRT